MKRYTMHYLPKGAEMVEDAAGPWCLWEDTEDAEREREDQYLEQRRKKEEMAPCPGTLKKVQKNNRAVTIAAPFCCHKWWYYDSPGTSRRKRVCIYCKGLEVYHCYEGWISQETFVSTSGWEESAGYWELPTELVAERDAALAEATEAAK